MAKNPPANAGDSGLIPGLEKSPGEGNGNPLLENPMDRGAWRATVHQGPKELDTTEQLNNNDYSCYCLPTHRPQILEGTAA